ncbi:MAG: MFS transporter [Burkholderiales bacterium]|nr:MFS transporter [Burkholderiales bacterium]
MYRIVLITVLIQGCHMGSKVAASLFAIHLGANPFLIGLLIATYSVSGLVLALYVGRVSDRFGSRRPMLVGSFAIGAGLLLPALWPQLAALYVSAALIGLGFVFFNVSVQNLAGGYGPPAERTRNFSMLALGYSGGHLIGPPIAGLAIDHYGYGAAYLCFAALTVVPVAMLAFYRDLESARHAAAERAQQKVLDLLRLPALRRTVIVGGLVATGHDLYSFYVPIYGHSIGLSASTIGTVLAMAAAATFVVRFLLPRLTRRFGIEGVLSAAMFAAAALFVPFPFVTWVPALCALSFCIGLALGCGQPLTLNIAYNRSPPGRSGEVAGLRLTVNNVTHIAVPVAAGAVGALLGVVPVFWASALLLATSGHLTRRID